MRKLLALMTVLIASLSSFARAETPTTLPSLKGLTPKQTLVVWQDRIFSVPASDVVEVCAYTNEKEKQYAQVIAEQMVATAKLQKAASLKWGKDANNSVLHACQSDTAEDDKQATEIITGDHAVVTFNRSELQPIPLVLVDGIWKYNIAISLAQSHGYTVDQMTAYTKLTTVAISAEKAALDEGKFADIDSLTKDLADQFAKIEVPQQ